MKSYLLLNALVWLYSISMFWVSKAVLRDVTGLGYVSVVLPVGFAIISLFDYVLDRATSDDSDHRDE